jgi:hypothetical protein
MFLPFIQCLQLEFDPVFRMAKLAKSNDYKHPSQVARSDLPPHLQDVVSPQQLQTQSLKLDKNLIGQTIRYHDSKQMKVQECKITDCGFSYMLGDWYMIVHSHDEKDMMIKATEMKDILEARVN